MNNVYVDTELAEIGRPRQWATLFVGDDEESLVALEKVLDWAFDYNIEVAVKALTDRNKMEYSVDQLTLRWFDADHPRPRVELVGLSNILDFVEP